MDYKYSGLCDQIEVTLAKITLFKTVFCVLLYIKEMYIFQVVGSVFMFLKIKTSFLIYIN